MRFEAGDLRELASLLDARLRSYGDPVTRRFFERAIDRLMVAFAVAEVERRGVS